MPYQDVAGQHGQDVDEISNQFLEVKTSQVGAELVLLRFGREINLAAAINTENRVYLIVVKCAYFATAKIQTDGSERFFLLLEPGPDSYTPQA